MDVVWFGGFRLRLLVMAAEAEAAAGLGLISWLVGRSCSTGSDAPPLSLDAAARLGRFIRFDPCQDVEFDHGMPLNSDLVSA